jgi:hypothetical protein
MEQYRKKQIVIEAKKFDGSYTSADLICSWGGKHIWKNCSGYGEYLGTISIYTLEGIMIASKGDYIIKGIKGEFYPCKPDIFELMYEKI